jgi:hypothetical protein
MKQTQVSERKDIKLRRDVVHVIRRYGDNDDGYVEASLDERFGMVWGITCDVWAFGGKGDVERRLQRDVTTLIRRKRVTTQTEKIAYETREIREKERS